MKLRNILFFTIGIVGGIYLTTKEGESARKKIKEYTDSLRPVARDLLKKLDNILENSKDLKSDEIRANIEMKAARLKEALSKIKPEDISDASKSIIKSVSHSIRVLRSEISTSPKVSSKRMKYEKMKVIKLRKIARQNNIQLQPTDKKSVIIDKLINKV